LGTVYMIVVLGLVLQVSTTRSGWLITALTVTPPSDPPRSGMTNVPETGDVPW